LVLPKQARLDALESKAKWTASFPRALIASSGETKRLLSRSIFCAMEHGWACRGRSRFWHHPDPDVHNYASILRAQTSLVNTFINAVARVGELHERGQNEEKIRFLISKIPLKEDV
jgi:hypothetical protein